MRKILDDGRECFIGENIKPITGYSNKHCNLELKIFYTAKRFYSTGPRTQKWALKDSIF
jgi:hypothetical protein